MRAEPDDSGLDEKRIEDLTVKILRALRDNYVTGPISRDRVYEALNALAYAAATAIVGSDGAQGEAREWFDLALEKSLVSVEEDFHERK